MPYYATTLVGVVCFIALGWSSGSRYIASSFGGVLVIIDQYYHSYNDHPRVHEQRIILHCQPYALRNFSLWSSRLGPDLRLPDKISVTTTGHDGPAGQERDKFGMPDAALTAGLTCYDQLRAMQLLCIAQVNALAATNRRATM
ncbi:uncharacterized protein F4817DRAFT_318646 [Daldinia loculata]|uniref:uncharacterized protein n=1 Tax=Daldinia loculata TaxID=103429 RepID=UPI0020C30853|nr:uncharacterized protein F4817DRAFT_318646 [Daldinia loculata]KAI1644644.1 hypothetical protein F4817DRAFT_318646 [Daldinia loculata]